MMNWWLDKGVDGFRMDVISLISKKKDQPRSVSRFGNDGISNLIGGMACFITMIVTVIPLK